MMLSRIVSAERFPLWLHTVAIVIAGVALLWFGWNAYEVYRTTAVTIEKIAKIKELQTTIMHLDEVLTMSARMAAATGELRWEERYRQYEPHLNAAIKEAIQLTPHAYNALAAAQTDAANRKLVEMEKRGFALVHQGALEEARTLLSSEEYEEQKRYYAAGMAQFTALLHVATRSILQSQATRAFFNIAVVIVAIPLSLLGWLLILRAMRRWMAATQGARAAAQQAEAALQEAYGALELRVTERTRELERVNQCLSAEIIERQRTEEALRESEARKRAIVEAALDCIITIDQEGRIIEFNPAAEKTFGYPHAEAIGQKVDELIIPQALRERHRQGLAQYRVPGAGTFLGKRLETTAIRADGTELSVEITVVGIRYEGQQMFTGFVRDITERQRLEAQLLEAQKMEAIGILAGGIAHDFNNILGAILGYTELTMDDVAPGSVASANLWQVLIAAQRAKDLVQHILIFSRQTAQERKPVQPGLLIKEVLALLRASLPSTIEMQEHLDGDVGNILADPTQIHQVVMNLCTNAAHAMRDTGGILEVRLDGLDIDADLATSLPPLHPGAHVRLTVRDTGHGMTSTMVARIFEPFFTTKGPGEGTGMGLAVVHGIIANHQGAITVESMPGHGTTFTIYLPQIVEAADGGAPLQGPIARGTERLLLVDDEPALADAGQAILRRLGYDVVVCTSGPEALTAFQAAPQRFDLVITDQTMPAMTGERLAIALRRIRPDIPIILCTGFSHTMTAERARGLGIEAFCMKPLMTHELGLTIRRVLEHHTPEEI